jgi:elongation factor Ts
MFMSISAQDVQKLRAACSVGMMEAKKALTEAEGDFDKAVELLRKAGAAKAAKKADREMSQGRVHSYIHGEGRVGVLIEISSETDFVARNEAFVAFCNDVAMHIAAMSPLYLSREEVPGEVVAKEIEIVKEQNIGKPEEVMTKIVEGKLEKYYEEVCLLDQKFIKDEDMTIAKLVESKILTIGENMKIRRFSRYELGL